MKFSLVAYGDESIQRLCEPQCYLMAATAYASDTNPAFQLRKAKPVGARKLHWYDLDPRRQAISLATVAQIAQQTTVVAVMPIEGVRLERARRKALEAMVRVLEEEGVGRLVLESRNPVHDKRDRELLVSMRRKGEAATFDLEHVPGECEPLLWVPDQILGAYGEVVTKGVNRRWAQSWKEIEKAIRVYEVQAR